MQDADKVAMLLQRICAANGRILWGRNEPRPAGLELAIELGYIEWIGGPHWYSEGIKITRKGRKYAQ